MVPATIRPNGKKRVQANTNKPEVKSRIVLPQNLSSVAPVLVGSDRHALLPNAQYVPESFRAWTTGGDKTCNGWSGSDYDHRSITIEVANIGGAPNWEISPAALEATIALVTDICRRRNIMPLWFNDPKMVGNAQKQSFALHRWFATKSCPGPHIISLMPYIAQTAYANLNNTSYWLNGYDYAPVFDPAFYNSKYPDLQVAFKGDADALWLHFQQFGMNEFRQASAEFDPDYYAAHNPDVVQAFKEDNPMYYLHYVMFGKAEGRKGAE